MTRSSGSRRSDSRCTRDALRGRLPKAVAAADRRRQSLSAIDARIVGRAPTPATCARLSNAIRLVAKIPPSSRCVSASIAA